MNEYQFATLVYTVLIISLSIRALVQITTVRSADVRSQLKQSVSRVHARLTNGKQLLHEKKKTSSMSKQVKFRKIPLKMLIDTLIHIENSGAVYIDIIGVQDSVQDVVTIAVEDEYMADNQPTPDNIDFINDKLSDEDLNDLMT